MDSGAMGSFPLSAVDRKYVSAHPIVVTIRLGEALDPERLYAALAATVCHVPDYSSCVTTCGHDYFLQRRPGFFGFSFEVDRRSAIDEVLSSDAFDFSALAGCLDDAPIALERPLLSVALTHLQTGCLLSISASHVVGDGESVKILMLVLFRLMLGRKLPELASQRTAAELAPATPALPATSYHEHAHVGRRVARAGRVLVEHVKAAKMQQLQLDYKHAQNGQRCTPNDVMAAFLLKRHSRALLPRAETLELKIPINVRSGRQRLNVAYVGNAYQSARLGLTRHELESSTLNELIARVRGAVAEVYDGRAPEAAASLPKRPEVVVSNAGDLSGLLAEMDAFAPSQVLVTSSDETAIVVQQLGDDHHAYLQLDSQRDGRLAC